jgi:prepilin-type N-terminal cleavage/methylation domain-containing protein
MRRRPDHQGMTIVELMVAITIFAVITAVVISFLTSSRRTYDDTSDRAAYQQSLRAVLSLLAREIRSAGCDPLEAGVDRFALADEDAMRCTADLTGDGDTLDLSPDEDVSYAFQEGDGTLLRTTAGGALTILRDVADVSFVYFDEDGNALGPLPLSAANRREVRYVQIAIQGATGDGEPITYATRVLVRNG